MRSIFKDIFIGLCLGVCTFLAFSYFKKVNVIEPAQESAQAANSVAQACANAVAYRAQKIPYQTAVWAEDLSYGGDFVLGYNQDAAIIAASVIKLPVMVVCF